MRVNILEVPNYAEIIGTLQTELDRMVEARDKIQKQIDGLFAAIQTIQAVAQDSEEPIVQPPALSPDEEQGFTDRVRAIFQVNPFRVFAPVEIRKVLLEQSPNLDPKIALIHTHNTLKRLFKQGEVGEVVADGRTVYHWNRAPAPDALAALKKSLEELDKKATEMKAVQDRQRRRG